MALSVIIPSQKADNLKVCVAAIFQHDGCVRVIVVDDGVDWERADEVHRWGHIVQGERPFIFARNCNIGIRTAGRDDVVLMNDDAILKERFGFHVLQEQWRQNQQFGLIASSVDKCGTPCQHRRSKNGIREATDPMVAFICVFIPRLTIDRVGLMDEDFGVNAGGSVRGYGCCDDDYCWRVRAAGLKLGVSDTCFVTHTELPSTFGFRDAKPGAPKRADIRPHKKLFFEKHGVDPHAWCR